MPTTDDHIAALIAERENLLARYGEIRDALYAHRTHEASAQMLTAIHDYRGVLSRCGLGSKDENNAFSELYRHRRVLLDQFVVDGLQ